MENCALHVDSGSASGRRQLIGSDQTAQQIDHLPIETTITFFLLNYCHRQDIPISLHNCSNEFISDTGELKIGGLKVEVSRNVLGNIACCTLPAIHEGCLVRAGLCGVLRHIIKSTINIKPELGLNELLGYKGICLKSCAEVSVWTKFCEVDMPGLVTRLQRNDPNLIPGEIPVEMKKLENHMQQPAIIPNISKRRRQMKKSAENSDGLEHIYAEGTDMTLTDLILFPCVTAYLDHQKSVWPSLVKKIPLVVNWYKRMQALTNVKVAMQKTGLPWLDLPEIMSSEGSKSDPESDLFLRVPDKKKQKSSAFQVAEVMKRLENLGVTPEDGIHPSGTDVTLPWEKYPSLVHPKEGGLPLNRVPRKCEQLENLAQAVLHLAKDGQTIVDFCSGGGHLGILLAHLLPKCSIKLVENKVESLELAQKRIEDLGFSNITLYQCNMDYFNGEFDIGVCLHACGVATDLVLQRCIYNKAAFVICPCCYGSIQNTHTMSYPRSEGFANMEIKYEEYLVLGHAADQTEVGIKQASNGKTCMQMIDWDRALLAREHGYEVTLCSLNPLTCSPKNNLLVGRPKAWDMEMSQ